MTIDSFPIRSSHEGPPTDSFPIRSGQEVPPAPRRGAQPGNTNALRHGFYSQRFSPRNLQSLLDHPQPDRQPLTLQAATSVQTRHLHILQAIIEDLAQAAAQGQGQAVPLLLHAIRSHTTLTALNLSLHNPHLNRLRSTPDGHSKCQDCGTIWQNKLLSPQGLCSQCSGD